MLCEYSTTTLRCAAAGCTAREIDIERGFGRCRCGYTVLMKIWLHMMKL